MKQKPASFRQEDSIATLYAGAFGRIEYLRCSGHRRERGKSLCARNFHIVVPFAGSFVWHPKGEEVFADATKALLVGADEDFAISHPAGGDRSLVLWPSARAMDELGRGNEEVFASRTVRSSRDIQLRQHALIAACESGADALAIEENFVQLLDGLIGGAGGVSGRAGAQATVSRAKAALHARAPGRTTLVDVARTVGVSPIYLTQLFRAAEGVPLYQYALNLRLTAALSALADAEDITGLAMDLGFSSHSHFSAAFRKRFGAPPSRVRKMLRAAQSASPAAPRSEVRPLCAWRGGSVDYPWS